jgi:hypothetical protein
MQSIEREVKGSTYLTRKERKKRKKRKPQINSH